jgi:hypothetical protein
VSLETETGTRDGERTIEPELIAERTERFEEGRSIQQSPERPVTRGRMATQDRPFPSSDAWTHERGHGSTLGRVLRIRAVFFDLAGTRWPQLAAKAETASATFDKGVQEVQIEVPDQSEQGKKIEVREQSH